jgi:hypothetical protein
MVAFTFYSQRLLTLLRHFNFPEHLVRLEDGFNTQAGRGQMNLVSICEGAVRNCRSETEMCPRSLGG